MLKHLVVALTLLQTLACSAPIYIVGSITEGLNSTPTLWIAQTTSLQSQPKPITLGSSSATASANAVVSIGNKIYSVGCQGTTKNATLWITDVESAKTSTPATTSISLSTEDSEAFYISLVGNQLFCVGYNDFTATLWITDTLGNNPKKIQLNEKSSLASSIAIYNKQIYIVGYYEIMGSYQAVLWITDILGNNLQEILLENQNGQAKSILIFDDQLFCLGSDYGFATLWITDLFGSLKSKSTLGPDESVGYSNTCIKKNSATYNLIANQYPYTNIPPQIVITNPSGKTLQTVVLTKEDTSAFINSTASITSYNNQIFAVGSGGLKSANRTNGLLWVLDADEFVTSLTIESQQSNAKGIFIPQGSQTIYDALHRFSPINFQKGL